MYYVYCNLLVSLFVHFVLNVLSVCVYFSPLKSQNCPLTRAFASTALILEYCHVRFGKKLNVGAELHEAQVKLIIRDY